MVSSEQHTGADAYLNDAQGRSVTPVIVPIQEQGQKGSTRAALEGLSLSTAPSRGLNSLADDPATFGITAASSSMSYHERAAAAELKKLANQKRHEGPTMGVEGSRLVNEKRRRGFLDDEDFEEILEDTEP